MTNTFDIIIVGGGIAGFGIAAFLNENVRVLLLEKEAFPGVHATGRSAALFSETYGSEPICALSRAGKAFLSNPPEAFELKSPLRPRGCLYIATKEQEQRLLQAASRPLMKAAAQIIAVPEATARCPILKPGYAAAALWEPGAQDIDVDALLQSFVRKFRSSGGTVLTSAKVTAVTKSTEGWRVCTGEVEYTAPILVNAAGAWADQVAELAGIAPLGIQPYQRTAVLVDPPAGDEIGDWPCVIDIDENFYFKPDAGKLLLSPADEEPMAPCDAQPEELDVAIAVDRVQQATTLPVRRVGHRWAGLRSFAPDRLPVVGFDPRAPGFFWLAGQGGYGIQTAPALSRLAASLVTGESVPIDISDAGLDPGVLYPARLVDHIATPRQAAAPQ
jgi:D-arginine dehydrogenase